MQKIPFDTISPHEGYHIHISKSRAYLREKLNQLVKKGFLAKRKILTESGTMDFEYKITQNGYNVLQKQESSNQFSYF